MKIILFAVHVTFMFSSLAAPQATVIPAIGDARLASLHKATENGNITAMVQLAGHYLSGSAGSREPALAERLYRRAAALGDADAIFHLGNMYLLGDGVPKDERQALRLFDKAAKQGHPLALKNYESLRKIIEPESSTITEEASTGTSNVDERRAIQIARRHGIRIDFNGTVVPSNATWDDEAIVAEEPGTNAEFADDVEYIEQSVAVTPIKIDPVALERDFQQGEKYYTGNGFKQDEAKAITLFRRAARGGHPQAIKRLLAIYRSAGIPAPRCGDLNVDNEICF